MISKKIYNNEYAPGIATYGLNGQTGEAGQNGNSIFYTSFDIFNNTGNGMAKFCQCIKARMLPLHNTTQQLSRDYQNGDYFFDNNGNIYCMNNIDSILQGTADNYSSVWSDYLVICGRMNTSTTNSFINKSANGRLNINNDYQGMDIIINNIGYNEDDSTYALRIMSDNTNSDNKVEFLCLTAINGYNVTDQLNIFYDNALGAYHINTSGPLLIDSEVKVKNSDIVNSVHLDGYTPVVINETPITTFYNICKHIKFQYYVNSDDDMGKIKYFGFTSDYIMENVNAYTFWQEIMNKLTLKIVFNLSYEPLNRTEADEENALPTLPLDKTYTHINKLQDEFLWTDDYHPWAEQIESDNDIWGRKNSDNTKYIIQKNFVTKYKDYDIELLSISLIYNTEIFFDVNNKDMVEMINLANPANSKPVINR